MNNTVKINCTVLYITATLLPKLRRSTSGGKGVPTNANIITNIYDNNPTNYCIFHNSNTVEQLLQIIEN